MASRSGGASAIQGRSLPQKLNLNTLMEEGLWQGSKRPHWLDDALEAAAYPRTGRRRIQTGLISDHVSDREL